jgi:hypothetical protein
MINAASRYAHSQVVTIVSNDGHDIQVITSGHQSPYVFTYVWHMVQGNERIDNIAYDYYKDATQWWKIGDGNPEILDWSSLVPGTMIRIPGV